MTARKRKPRRGNGRAVARLPDDALMERVASELHEFADMLFWDHPAHSAEDARALGEGKAAWSRPVAKLLAFIHSRDDISDKKKDELATALFEACLLSDTSVTVERDSIDRYEDGLVKMRAARARAEREAHNNDVDKIVEHYARQRWRENPARRRSALGTARDILRLVNDELLERSRDKISERTLRQRISKLRMTE